MALTTGPNLGLLDNGAPGEAHYAELMRQWRWMDFWLQPMIKSRVAALPTVGQIDGDTYIITAAGADQHKIARWSTRIATPAWEYMAPKTGWRVHVANELDANDQVKTVEYVGGTWVDRVVASGGVASVNGQTGAVTLTAGSVSAIPASYKGAANGVATLGVDGKVPGSQLPASTANTQSIIIACSDETTALTVGTAKVTFRMPYGLTLSAVRASLTTAQTGGSTLTVDINEGGVSVLSTKLTIDNGEKSSVTAAAAAVISDSALADDAEITIDIDQVGDSTAKGLKVMLIGTPQ